MSAISDIGLMTAFTVGVISFLSPCVLPLVPGYVSYVSSSTANASGQFPAGRMPSLFLSSCFVFGFSTVFIALGASATFVSRVLLSYRYEMNLIGGAIITLFGVFMTGLVRMPWLERDLRFHGGIRGGRPAGAYLLGLAFGFGWTPCIGPVLGAILTVSALSTTALAGIILLATYSMGLGTPFLVAAFFTESFAYRLRSMRSTGRALQAGAGVVMIAMGVAVTTGYMSVFSFWLLENFPMLSTIG